MLRDTRDRVVPLRAARARVPLDCERQQLRASLETNTAATSRARALVSPLRRKHAPGTPDDRDARAPGRPVRLMANPPGRHLAPDRLCFHARRGPLLPVSSRCVRISFLFSYCALHRQRVTCPGSPSECRANFYGAFSLRRGDCRALCFPPGRFIRIMEPLISAVAAFHANQISKASASRARPAGIA